MAPYVPLQGCRTAGLKGFHSHASSHADVPLPLQAHPYLECLLHSRAAAGGITILVETVLGLEDS